MALVDSQTNLDHPDESID